MNAELISIGSELLLGQIVDTNASWMAQRLAENGVNLFYKTTVGDNFDRMAAILDSSLDRADVVITGGGIGPTQDDLTRQVVAKVTGRDVVVHQPSLKELHERFQKRGFILTRNNERQAMVPDGAIVVKNPNGTAPAFIVEDPRGVVISLPGVPFEMKWLFDNEVLPYLRDKFGLTQTIHYRVLKVADIGESAVDDRIGRLIAESGNPTVGVLAHPGQVDVRITARADSKEKASALIGPVEKEVRDLIGDHIFATDDETMASVAGKLLARADISIATCEDLSGGAVADTVQEAAGPLFAEGVVLNSNAALERLAESGGEKPPFPDGEVRSKALARAIRKLAGTGIGLAIHAVAEGDQRTENLGRGETYIALATDRGVSLRHVRSAGSGRPDRQRAALHALSLLRRHLLELPG